MGAERTGAAGRCRLDEPAQEPVAEARLVDDVLLDVAVMEAEGGVHLRLVPVEPVAAEGAGARVL
jgi:hypothetical protein